MYFMALGGGQRIGASCYYLKLGESNIILDAGTGLDSEGVIFEPNLYALKTSPFVTSLTQINQIFVSHAHMDHIGYLPKLIQETPMADVYMTDMTKTLTEFQLYDKTYTANQNQMIRLGIKSCLDKIVPVTYAKPMKFKDYTATFFSAGHIPGAMMILFEYNRRKILYTGDYSVMNTALTDGCFMFEGYNIDTIIMCGVHAKHPKYTTKNNYLHKILENIERQIFLGKKVKCYVPQLTKGIEFIKILNERNRTNTPIYIDEGLLGLIDKMGTMTVPILTKNNYPAKGNLPNKPHIYVSSSETFRYKNYENIRVDFSLHEDFDGIKKFVQTTNPKHIIVVHCGSSAHQNDHTIEQHIMYDGHCRTQFIFAAETEIYNL
ncbi:MAG: hypothetical protein ATN35_06430 [Epulopiscium sp. Nele67-Bin004]|nr:MAG: hypothetical protein ATN35_06430 [Epulopiscium sp. Nele67-Bin004]